MVRTRVSVSRSSANSWACRGREAAVAADVEVPAVVGGDHADVLAAGLGALPGAAGDAELDLVRRPQAAVAQLEVDGQPDGVLDAVPAPGRADAGLHRPQRLAVGVPGLEAGVDQPLPDRRQLLEPGAEEVDPLAAGDLGVEAEVLGDLADRDQAVRRDLARRRPAVRRSRCRPSAGWPSRGRWCPGAGPGPCPARGPVPSEDRIEATTGRQMSQPRPVPCAPMISLKVRSPVTETMSKSWARLNSKCSQSALLTVDARTSPARWSSAS